MNKTGVKPKENITEFLTSMGYTSTPIRQNVAGQLLIFDPTLIFVSM
jgi:hypothetical protein